VSELLVLLLLSGVCLGGAGMCAGRLWERRRCLRLMAASLDTWPVLAPERDARGRFVRRHRG
jgi:hypothetical protein